MALLMGIDIGTSGTKTLICNEKGDILATVSEEHPISHPKPAWSEQDPEDWWRATVTTVQGAISKAGVNPSEIKGVGLSGQMHGSVFLDKDGQVLRPAILWNDQRTGAECAEMTEAVGGRAALIEHTSNPALTGFTAPKILWVRKHEPDVYDKVRKILLPKDYIRFRLTGIFATEVSDASGTLLLDVKKRRWSDAVLSALSIDKALLPECYESPEVSGKITKQAAKATGLAEGTPVVGGGGDQAAGAVGNGIIKKGVLSATLGTSGVVFAFADTVATDPQGRVHTFCHAIPGKWHIMGVVLAAGGSFQWLRNNLGEKETELAAARGVDPYEILCDEAFKAPPGSEGLIFLPYLTGERTPHADPDARACWIGITPRHTKPYLVRSVMEGATYAMRDSLEIIRGMGVDVNEIRASGGGARSPVWRQIQADIYGNTVCTINATEGPAFGVALLAGVGTGLFSSVEEACEAAIRTVSTTGIRESNRKVYDAFYSIYRGLYGALKGSFKSISSVVHSS